MDEILFSQDAQTTQCRSEKTDIVPHNKLSRI